MTEGQAALWRAGLALWSKDGWRGISQTLTFSPSGGVGGAQDGMGVYFQERTQKQIGTLF